MQKHGNGGFTLTEPHEINAFRLLSLKGRLKMELLGMKFRGGSTFAMVKREFGFKGKKLFVYCQYLDMLVEKGILESATAEKAKDEGKAKEGKLA